MLNSHIRFKFLLLAFVFPSLACVMQAVTADTRQAREMSTAVSPSLSAAPVPSGGEKMTVIADTVYVRPSPGMSEYPIGKLKNGQVVEVVAVEVVGDTLWCQHHSGWTACKYLEAR